MNSPLAPPRHGRAWTAGWAIAIVLLVAGSGLAVWYASGGADDVASKDASPNPAQRPKLSPGNDYYVYVKLIELADHAPNGSTWDRVDKSGPDIGFRLTWRGNVVWDAAIKPDTLLGSWDLMKIDLKQVVMSGGKADIEGALNAPLIHYQPGETVELSVWDADPVGAYDDAGKVILRLDDLSPGETTIAPAGGAGAKAVKRVVLAMIDRRTPVPELIQTMSNR